MTEYFVCFDGNLDYQEGFINAADNDDLFEQVSNVLWNLEGGHADIFDEDGEFFMDVEV